MLGRIRLAPKLIGGFLLVTLACCLLGYSGVSALNGMYATFDETNNNTVPTLVGLQQMTEGLTGLQRGQRALLLNMQTKREANTAEAREYLAAKKKQFDEGRTRYETTRQFPKEEQIWKEWVPQFDAWKRAHDDVLAAVDQNDAAKVMDLNDKELRLSRPVNALLQEIVSLYEQHAKEETAKVEASLAAAKRNLYAYIALSMVGALVLGSVLTLSITRPLGRAVNVLEAVAKGDLSQKLEAHGEDEVARIGQAVNKAVEALRVAAEQQKQLAERQKQTAAQEQDRIRREQEQARQLAEQQQRQAGEMAEQTRRQAEEKAEQQRHQAEAERQQAERQKQQADELLAKVDSLLETVNAAADGDLTREVTVVGEDAIGRVGRGLGRLLENLRGSVSAIARNAQSLSGASEELAAVSGQMSTNANETGTQAGVVSAASAQVSASVQTVATGIEEMGASIKEIAKNASEAARVATDAVRVAETTNATVSKLGESSAEIGQVIKVITSIAQQTNLLALNATIEAARAGEAGKGFAVVANEVKELAKETARATEEIGQKIEAIQTDTKGAVDAIGKIGVIIAKINDISSTIASAVEEQTATTNEIGRNVSEVARSSADIAQNITSVATAARGTTEGAGNSQQAAAGLARMAAELQELVGQFVFDKPEKGGKPVVPSRSGGRANGRGAALAGANR